MRLESADIMPVYRLCWAGGWYKKIYIDALTGKIYKIIDNESDNMMINVSAHVMPYSDNIGSFLTTVVSLDSTEVTANCDGVPSEIRYTNGEGSILLLGNEITDIESCLMASCGIKVFKESGGWVKHNSLITDLPSLVFNYTDTDSVPTGNPSNLYYSALRFRDKIKELMVLNGSNCYYGSTKHEPIITADCDLGPQINGEILYGMPGTSSQIKISTGNGRYSSTLCHEMTHDMVNRSLQFHRFRYGSTSELRGAMDDAFSSYFPCMYRNNPYYRSSLYTKDLSDPALTVASVHSSEYPTSTVNEDIYARYDMRFPLASAWWDLRNRTHFPDLNDNDFNAVDTLLVGALGIVREEIPLNANYRYKPRYFYNILMSRVDTDNSSWPLNDKQAAIDSAYSERGFHFYPTVISAVSDSVNNPVGKQTYNVLDSVFVHIKNCPQNTKVEILIIPHQSYAHVGSGGVPIPAAYNANGNPVSREVRTNSNGVWAGGIPYSNQLPQGDYDIIVNIGSDCDKPDDKLNLVFAKDNVIDAVDGLNGPGFIKTGFGDMAVALDLSSSMQDYGNHLAQTVKVLEQSMISGQRINVFGFTEGTASQPWLKKYYNTSCLHR